MAQSKAQFEADYQQGVEYQDFLAVELAKRGLILNNLQSRKAQKTQGENLLGLEIKYDRKFRDTGNLFFETHFNSAQGWQESGILLRQSWLYGMGDYRTLWLFSTRLLRELIHGSRAADVFHRCDVVVGNDAARGCLMTVENADKECLRKIEFN